VGKDRRKGHTRKKRGGECGKEEHAPGKKGPLTARRGGIKEHGYFGEKRPNDAGRNQSIKPSEKKEGFPRMPNSTRKKNPVSKEKKSYQFQIKGLQSLKKKVET